MKTRDGRQVRIFCHDGGGEFPIMGAVTYEIGNAEEWGASRWSRDGRSLLAFHRFHDIHADDLPEFREAIKCVEAA